MSIAQAGALNRRRERAPEVVHACAAPNVHECLARGHGANTAVREEKAARVAGRAYVGTMACARGG